MRVNAQITPDSMDHIQGVLCRVDGAPIIRIGDLSLMLTWDQLRKLHAECIKLEVTAAKEAA